MRQPSGGFQGKPGAEFIFTGAVAPLTGYNSVPPDLTGAAGDGESSHNLRTDEDTAGFPGKLHNGLPGFG